ERRAGRRAGGGWTGAGGIVPSDGTTRSVLSLTGACFQSACVATRTRSAPRKGRRCERGCAELRGGRPVTTLRRPGPAGSLGRAPASRDVVRQRTGGSDVLVHEGLVRHPEPELRLDEEEDLHQC